MNLQLINPFAQNFPERVDSSIDACAQCVSFNGKGTSRFAGNLVAVGRNDGGVSVLDLETRAYVRVLEGHVKAVTSVCWSRNSRYLLSSSRDWNIIIWDILTGDRRSCIRFDAPILSASLHPRNSKLVIAILQNQGQAVLVDLRHETEGRWHLDVAQYAQVVEEEIAQKTAQELEDEENARKTAKKNKKGKGTAAPSSSKRRKDYATVGRFTPRGDLIYIGTSQGYIYIFDTQTKQLVHSESISSPASIKDIEFDRTGTSLVVNSNDRSIRVYDILELAFYATAVPACVETLMSFAGSQSSEASTSQLPAFLTLRHRFQDLVNRTPWNAIGFTNDGDFIVGGAGHKAAQQVYVWDRANGSLSKILEGPKDCLDDFDWHPVRPILVTASDQGLLHIWVTNVIERYSAYAAGFEELEENLEYQEREDEFDVEDEMEAERRKLSIQDVLVDVIGAEGLPTVSSELIHAGQPGYMELQAYLASSDAWADAEPDEDDQDDFAPPLDIDIHDYELEYEAQNAIVINA